MKRFLIFNSGLFGAFLVFLVQVGHLTWINFLSHIAVVTFLIILILGLLLPLVRFADRRISYSITLLFVFISFSYLVANYAIFYLALENWGHPMNLVIISVYAKDLSGLIKNLPWSFEVVLISAILLVGLILMVSAYLTQMIFPNIVRCSLYLLRSHKLRNLTILSLGWVSLIGLLNWNYFILVLKYKSNLTEDPVLSLYIQRSKSKNEILPGLDQLKSKKDYPDNLSFDKKNVVLIICDALRADHIGAYGYERATTPFLDSIISASNSIMLERYYATSSFSFTGINNTLSSDYKIRSDQFFVHDLLKKQGYKVNFLLGGDHTNFYGLRESYGESLDVYKDGFTTLSEECEDHCSVNDDALVLENLAALEEYSGDPNFFYLHFMSVHQAGTIESKYEKFFPNKVDDFQRLSSVNMINDYDNRLNQLDDYLRMCIGTLNAKGFLENAIVIITSDHGQALMEQERYWHSKSTDWSEVYIPFIMLQTGNGFERLDNPQQLANQLDVAPTIVDLLGLKQPEVWLGRSIFSDEKRDWIFQKQSSFYSVIWSADDNRTYQYNFNNRSKEERVFRFTNDTAVNINPSSVSRVDKARLAVISFFKI